MDNDAYVKEGAAATGCSYMTKKQSFATTKTIEDERLPKLNGSTTHQASDTVKNGSSTTTKTTEWQTFPEITSSMTNQASDTVKNGSFASINRIEDVRLPEISGSTTNQASDTVKSVSFVTINTIEEQRLPETNRSTTNQASDSVKYGSFTTIKTIEEPRLPEINRSTTNQASDKVRNGSLASIKTIEGIRLPEIKGSTINQSSDKVRNGSVSGFKTNDFGGLAGVESFEDILEIIGTLGRWNITIFILCSLITLVNAIQSMNYEFLGATPDYWCHVGPLVNANWTKDQIFDLAIPKIDSDNGTDHDHCKMFNYNYSMAVINGYDWSMKNLDALTLNNDSSPVHCGVRDFDKSFYTSTVVTEWDLVCERRALYPTTQSVSQMGSLFGAPVCGYMLDEYGRRPVVLVTVAIYLLSAIGAAVSPNYTFYALMRALLSSVDTGIYVGCFVIVMELCTPRLRSIIGTLFAVPYALGYMMVPYFAYIVRPWRLQQLAYTLPCMVTLSYFWLLPESPRWLLSRGETDRALSIVLSAAKVNGRPTPPSGPLLASLNALATPKRIEKKVSRNIVQRLINNIAYAFSLIINSELRIRTLVSYVIWLAVPMVYFGVSLNAANMSVNLYYYQVLGGVIEIVSYFLLLIMVAHMKRKSTMISLCALCAVTIFTIAVLFGVVEDVPTGVTTALSLCGKLGITAAFHFIYLYTAEIFPTKYRSLAISECGIMSHIGGAISPYINDLLGAVISWAPSVVFATASLLAAGLSLVLPETKDTDLLEEVPEKKRQDPEEVQKY